MGIRDELLAATSIEQQIDLLCRAVQALPADKVHHIAAATGISIHTIKSFRYGRRQVPTYRNVDALLSYFAPEFRVGLQKVDEKAVAGPGIPRQTVTGHLNSETQGLVAA